MKGKFKNFFRDWKLKLGAFGLAIAVWVAILGFVDPSITRTIPNVPITITNDSIFSEAGKSYTVDGRLYSSVRVNGPSSIVGNLTAGDFAATADLSQMFDVTGQVPVTVTCSARGAQNITYSPVSNSLKINIEDIISKNFEIKVDSEGTLADGYLLGAVKADPAFVTVKAPESVLERIAEVRVAIDLQDLTDNASFICKPVYYSTVGAELDFTGAKDTVFSVEEVKVNVEIFTMKTVPVVINVAGQDEVASGYRYTGAQQSVAAVKVSGLRSRLAALTSITIPETDLTVAGASEDVAVSIALAKYLPEGIDLVDGEDPVLTVVLQVAPLIVKAWEVELTLNGKNSNYEYVIHNVPLHVQLRALEEDFKGITEQHITATLDVAGYGPGDYNLTVNVELDSVFELYGTPRVNLSIIDPNVPESTEEDTSEDEQ